MLRQRKRADRAQVALGPLTGCYKEKLPVGAVSALPVAPALPPSPCQFVCPLTEIAAAAAGAGTADVVYPLSGGRRPAAFEAGNKRTADPMNGALCAADGVRRSCRRVTGAEEWVSIPYSFRATDGPVASRMLYGPGVMCSGSMCRPDGPGRGMGDGNVGFRRGMARLPLPRR